MTISRTRERLGGAVLLAVGLWLTVYGWHAAAAQGWFNPAGALFGPAGIVLGAALLAVPGYRTERTARGEDISALQGWALLTPRWRVVTALALGLGALNWLLIEVGRAPDLFS